MKYLADDDFHSTAHLYQDAYANDPVVFAFIDRALRYLAPQSYILDVGCGTGKPVAVRLAAAGHQIEGLDKSPTMIDFIRENVPSGKFQVADMCTYERSGGEGTLDAVFNVRALFRNKRNIIEMCVGNWAKWLKRGGLLCMVVLAADDYNPAKVKQYDEDGHSARVERRFMGDLIECILFSRVGWKHLLNANGLDILDEKMEIFLPPENVDSDEAAQYCFIARKL
ncbi:S-adenosyl-L-methionine-dependent methyltransferase [Penicillium manginii]|jgi:SAM-dependent methyltransferase|uniref:S-adenosyl-L-methionine-dependent methyltransferase n=1 Tax=Penicillium manginii TaxID=203109 RepID=UPI002546AF10|nr:S-adenosyl-L-methionine-dependent methyltransferase [Penicillium manginii]KAJ5745042.1 S-adenosyl-L-methionine-dependent methyltransferase [Penicillium manginii]